MYLINDCNAIIDTQTKVSIMLVFLFDGSTALHLALKIDNIEIIKYMIEDAQADITLTTKSGENVFDLSYRSKYRTDIVVMLLQRLQQQSTRGLKRKIHDYKDEFLFFSNK
jgi:ankyrin repeat protein